MRQHSVKFGFEARYFQLGELNEHTKKIVFVLHGYGQQAKYFIRKFQGIENEDTCIIAPEGLSRFYLKGFSGRVGATWMTKEERLTDIANYISYLNQIYSNVLSIFPPSNLPNITLLGFSQGAATASRWAVNGLVSFDRLILWAGIFPPDMDFEKASMIIQNKEIHYVYGTEDPFITEERLTEMQTLSSRLEVSPKVTTFTGVHDIDPATLKDLF
ncbi:serine hydrolase family protein [Fulvivirga maritima]|uniref:alpha/beta hydrolase n=1 Tax=Fulvivirga maritima TaxID=2904247 RepID=UPI001F36890D|nr:serine hydrolase family protein [Fulvivirga maritima]UII29328.1 serine hydrolase family protein [Fulvivirga maritima]